MYTGELVPLPVIPNPNSTGNYTELWVALTGTTLTDQSGARNLTDSDLRMPALIDSGSTGTALP